MSGRLSIGFVAFAAVSFELDRARCGSFRPFLVRNWCGYPVRATLAAASCTFDYMVDATTFHTDLRSEHQRTQATLIGPRRRRDGWIVLGERGHSFAARSRASEEV
ncbi:hypothetical protein CWO90_24780 [Bradyrhizobium sp. Leo121]|nr:hypothetical protein CWO90_24780 [Bradyrhizobium sp. Leo121]